MYTFMASYHTGESGGRLLSMQIDFGRALRAQQEGKAIIAHPALMDTETPLSVYSPGASRQDAVLSQRNAQRHGQAYGGDQAIDWVYDSIGLYTDATSTAPWHLEKEDGTRLVKTRTAGTPPEYELGPRELYSLLEKPNPHMTYAELIDLLIIDLMLVGNAYWYKFPENSDKPLALYRMAPGYVKIVPGEWGPKRYEYKPPGARDKLKIDPANVIHYRRPNPHDAYYGMGIIQGGGRAFDLELAITDTMAAYYENRADPSMIVQSERRVPRDVFNKLRAQLRARASGSRNAGELLVLEAGLKAETLSASARDALFADLSKMSQDRVYSKFRASRKLFGLLDEAGGDKISDARREFDNATLRPFMDRLQTQITNSLAAAYGVKYVIDYRYQMSTEDIVKTGSDFASVPGIKVREVRRYFAPLGIEESTGDPDIDEMVLNVPGEELDANGQGGLADNAQASDQPGAPAKGKNVAAFPRGGGSLPAGARVRRPAGKSLSISSLLFQERAAAVIARAEGKALEAPAPVTVGNKLPNEQRPSDPSAESRTLQIEDSMAYITAGLTEAATALERELLDHSEGKALYTGKTSNVVARVRNSAAWTTFRKRVQEVLAEGDRRAAQAGALNAGVEPEDELDYDAIAGEIVNRPEGLRSIIKTLKDRVAGRVRDARAADADIPVAIQTEMRDWVENQLPAIADSEATEAYNEGTLSAAEAAGVETVFVTEEEDAPDKPCQEADGQVWDIGHAREHRKEHPRCRRAFIPLAEAAVN